MQGQQRSTGPAEAGADGLAPQGIALHNAREAHKAGDYARAVREARIAVDGCGPAEHALRAEAALALGKSLWNLDEVEACAQALQICLDDAQAPDLRHLQADALALMGACHARSEQPAAAVGAMQRAVDLLDESMPAHVLRSVYTGVGQAYQGLSLCEQAADAYQSALDIVRAVDDASMQLRAAMNLCYAIEEAVWQGRHVDTLRADARLQQGLSLLPWMLELATGIGSPHAEMVYHDAAWRLRMPAGQHEAAHSSLLHLIEMGADAAGDLRCDWHLAMAELAREVGRADDFNWHVAAARLAAGDAYVHPRYPADLRRAAELLALEGQADKALALAWRYHARMLHNETAALQGRLDETVVALAQKSLVFEVAQLRAQNAGLESSVRQMTLLSQIDPLTGVLNRRGLESAHFAGKVRAMHLLLIDLDHFKRINDTFGHAVGDQVLRRVAQVVTASLRDRDHVGRHGGEEFVALLDTDVTADAVQAAERLRVAVNKRDWGRLSPGLTVSFSGGLVELRQGESLEQAVARADALLYQAKAEGRNRVITDPDLGAWLP
jgi:diguanylate cyclase (GGDEF)-like protein